MVETLPPAAEATPPRSEKPENEAGASLKPDSEVAAASDPSVKNETTPKGDHGGATQPSEGGSSAAPAAAVSESSASEEDARREGVEEAEDSDSSDAQSSASSEKDEPSTVELTALELLQRGKAFFKKGEFDASADTFSRAVEKKMAEVGGEEFSPALGVYYLWFGDALLSKEEQTDDLFASIPQPASSTSSSSTAERQQEQKQPQSVEGSDEELAFQMLEMAKQCLSRALKYVPAHRADSQQTALPQEGEAWADGTSSPAASRAADSNASAAAEGSRENEAFDRATAASDLAFAFMRLGDMQLMNNNFDEAASEYSESIAVREAFGLPEASLLAPTLSLAQAIYFSGKVADALDKFRKCELLARRILSGELPLPEGTDRKVVEETLEDLKIQTSDIERQLQENPKQAQQKGSQCEAKELINKTSSDFDKPVLAHSGTVKRVVVTPTVQQRQEGEPKKRKIDLRQLKSPEAHNSSGEACDSTNAGEYSSEERENKLEHQKGGQKPASTAEFEKQVCAGSQGKTENSAPPEVGRVSSTDATKALAEWSGESLCKRRSLASSGGAL